MCNTACRCATTYKSGYTARRWSSTTGARSRCSPTALDVLRQVNASVNVPICVGERLYTRFDFVRVLAERLAEYIMPDVVWTGGISELRKIANLAEAFYVPISPRDGRHFRAFINDQRFVRQVVARLESKP